MVVGAKVCELTDGFLWFVCGLYVGILMSSLTGTNHKNHVYRHCYKTLKVKVISRASFSSLIVKQTE